MNKTILALTGALVVSFATPVWAAPAPFELVNEVKVEKITVAQGREQRTLVEPAVVVPGDRLVFTTRYRNNTGKPVSNIVVTNPIRQGIALASEGAANLDVSVDNGATWGKLAALTVAAPDGSKRPAQAADVTHVRWVLASIAPGGNGSLSFNAIVR